jgi:hypothetical protein
VTLAVNLYEPGVSGLGPDPSMTAQQASFP